MSEKKKQSVATSSRNGKQTVQSHHPIWMAHWMRPGSNVTADRGTLRAHEKEEVDQGYGVSNSRNGLDASSPAEALRDIETRAFEIGNSNTLENERSYWSLMNHDQYTDYRKTFGREFGQNIERGKAIDWEGGTRFPPGIPNVKGAIFKGCNSPGEGTSKTTFEGIKSHISAKDKSFDAPRHFDGTVMRSLTRDASQPNVFGKAKDECDKGKAIISPLTRKPFTVANNHLPYPNLRLNKAHDYNLGPFFDRNDRPSELDNAINIPLREFNSSLLCDTPSTSDHPVPTFGRDWFQKMQNHPGIALLPSQCTASERTELRTPCFNSYSLQKLPMYAHDMKTMRICATVDSMEQAPGGFPRFCQTTHSLLITKDVNLSKENKDFRTKEFIAELNRNTSSDIHGVLPFSGQCSRGVQLQSLSSSSSGEGKRNIENVEPVKVMIKNESSAETDIMDVDLFKEENSIPGSNYTPTNKEFTWIGAGSSMEVGRQRALPDINLEVPAVPDSSTENGCPTSSRTQSLEMDTLLAHSDQPKADPTMRWIKRLKLGCSNSSSQCTRSSNLEETSSPNKMKKHFKRILESGIASSEPSPRKTIITSHKNRALSNDDKNIVADRWIKRWMRNGSKVTKKPSATATRDPQKSTLDDFPKKQQFPSIAAMALMAKAMSGFETCELHKRGSFTVWNTKTF